tara:strand:- start:412 stop:1950 length:1539 start_codon:yes stop_codon:yes gene_type:complete
MVEKKKKKVKRKTKPRPTQVISQKVIVNLGKGYATKRRTGTQAKRSVPQQVIYQQNPIPLQPNYSSQINDLRNEVIASRRTQEHNTGNLLGQREVALQEGIQSTDVQTERQMSFEPPRFFEEADSGTQTEPTAQVDSVTQTRRRAQVDGGTQTKAQDPNTEREVGRAMSDMISKVELRREQDFKPVVALQAEPKPAPKVVQEKKHSQRHAELMRAHQEAVKAHEDTMRREIEFRERASRASQDRIAQTQIRASSDYMIALASQERDSTDLLERQKSFVEDVEKKQKEKKKEIQDEMEVARTVEGLIGGVEARERKQEFSRIARIAKDHMIKQDQQLKKVKQLSVQTKDFVASLDDEKKDEKTRKKRSDAGVPRGELLRTADRRAQAAGFAVVSVPRETQQLEPPRAAQFEVQGNLRTFKPSFESIKKPMGSALTPTLEDRTAFLGKAQAAFTGEGQTTSGKKKIKVGRLKTKAAQLKFEDAVRRSRESADEPFVGLGAAEDEEVTASVPTFI